MRPFLTTLLIATVAAAALWWHQRQTIASLCDALKSPPGLISVAPEKQSGVRTARKKTKEAANILRRADGTPVITARSVFRGALQAADHVRGLGRVELEALISADDFVESAEFLGISLAAWGRLGELDPAAALKRAGALARTKEDSSAFYIVMHDWLIRDRAAALKWFHAQPDTNAKAGFLGVAGMVLAGSDAELLAQLTGSIEDPDIHRKSLTLSLTSLSLTDPEATIARFGELPNSESKREVLMSLIMVHGDKNPRQLLELALPLALEDDGRNDNLGMLLNHFSTKEPQAALEWFTSRTPEETARMIHDAQSSMSGLGKLETAAVRAVGQNRPQEDRDWLLANHYGGRPLDDPPALLGELTAGIGDEKLRNGVVLHVLDRCVREGREAQLEPWIAAQPAAAQIALRAQVVKMKR